MTQPAEQAAREYGDRAIHALRRFFTMQTAQDVDQWKAKSAALLREIDECLDSPVPKRRRDLADALLPMILTRERAARREERDETMKRIWDGPCIKQSGYGAEPCLESDPDPCIVCRLADENIGLREFVSNYLKWNPKCADLDEEPCGTCQAKLALRRDPAGDRTP